MSFKNSIIVWLEDHYENMPPILTKIVGLIGNSLSYNIRYGKEFNKTIKELKRTEYLSRQELDAIVLSKLLTQVNYAYDHVPYYKERYRDFDIRSIHSLEDFAKLPLIDKSIVKANENQFISDIFDKKDLILKKTSGSTGMPLGIYMNKNTTQIEWAFVVHIWERIGFNHRSSRLVMREIDQKKKGDCYFDYIKNRLRINISNMTDEKMAEYCRAIEKYRPDFIQGYPSATLQLCKYIEQNGINHQFKGFLPSSEGMGHEEVEYIRKVLNCPILSFYGHTERLLIAGQCEKSEAYHVEPLYGYCELVDESGNIIEEEGVTGEVVATGFCNTGMPLIRYRTGDLAQWSFEKCSCGRNYRLLKRLEGRTTEYLVDANGNKIALTSLRYSFYEQHVKAFQFYQDTPGYVTVRIIIEPEYSYDDEQYIQNTLTEDTNNLITFRLKKTDVLSKKKSGKRELIVQAIK